MVISHPLDLLAPDVGVFVLQTGMMHRETLQLLDQLKATSRLAVTVYRPRDPEAVEFVAREGENAMHKSVALRKACCAIRKMEPLQRALAGKKAWITGLRREQSGTRAVVPHFDRSDPAIVKVNPLATCLRCITRTSATSWNARACWFLWAPLLGLARPSLDQGPSGAHLVPAQRGHAGPGERDNARSQFNGPRHTGPA